MTRKQLVAAITAEYTALIPNYFSWDAIVYIASHKGKDDATLHLACGNECIGIAIQERAYFNVTGERLTWTPEQETLMAKVQNRTKKTFIQIATNYQ